MYLLINTLLPENMLLLFRGGEVVGERIWEGGHEYDTLMPEISALLSHHGVGFPDLSGVTVVN